MASTDMAKVIANMLLGGAPLPSANVGPTITDRQARQYMLDRQRQQERLLPMQLALEQKALRARQPNLFATKDQSKAGETKTAGKIPSKSVKTVSIPGGQPNIVTLASLGTPASPRYNPLMGDKTGVPVLSPEAQQEVGRKLAQQSMRYLPPEGDYWTGPRPEMMPPLAGMPPPIPGNRFGAASPVVAEDAVPPGLGEALPGAAAARAAAGPPSTTPPYLDQELALTYRGGMGRNNPLRLVAGQDFNLPPQDVAAQAELAYRAMQPMGGPGRAPSGPPRPVAAGTPPTSYRQPSGYEALMAGMPQGLPSTFPVRPDVPVGALPPGMPPPMAATGITSPSPLPSTFPGRPEFPGMGPTVPTATVDNRFTPGSPAFTPLARPVPPEPATIAQTATYGGMPDYAPQVGNSQTALIEPMPTPMASISPPLPNLRPSYPNQTIAPVQVSTTREPSPPAAQQQTFMGVPFTSITPAKGAENPTFALPTGPTPAAESGGFNLAPRTFSETAQKYYDTTFGPPDSYTQAVYNNVVTPATATDIQAVAAGPPATTSPVETAQTVYRDQHGVDETKGDKLQLSVPLITPVAAVETPGVNIAPDVASMADAVAAAAAQVLPPAPPPELAFAEAAKARQQMPRPALPSPPQQPGFLARLFSQSLGGMPFQQSGTTKGGTATGMFGNTTMGGYTTPSGFGYSWPMAGEYVTPGGFLDMSAPGLTQFGGYNPSSVFR